MDHLGGLGSSFEIPIQPDESGLTGRECPNSECEGYFTIEFGTGLKGEGLPCHCPYCGHSAPHDQFWTKEQIEYAKSVAMRDITDAFVKDLKRLEFDHKPRGAFGIGISMKVEPGRPIPIRYYREKSLETELVCDHCTLRYAIYGVFAFCPDCAQHNSPHMLDKNLEVVIKKIDWAATLDTELAKSLREDALSSIVAAFDGFGREACRVHAKNAHDPAKAESISFQNLEGARKRVQDLFAFDLTNGLKADSWSFTHRCFQKRHLLAHKMGVVDQAYIAATNDPSAIVGRRASVTGDEVLKLVSSVRVLGRFLVAQLEGRGKSVFPVVDGEASNGD